MGKARGMNLEEERRRTLDRRKAPTPMFSRYTLFGGRRWGGRRKGEKYGNFVDQHGALLLLVLLLVATFNIVDAYFTLFFLGEGAQEVNPVALYLLELGPWVFVLAKSLGIGLCLGFLCLARNFRMAQAGLGLVFAMYFSLTLYHLFLMSTQLPGL